MHGQLLASQGLQAEHQIFTPPTHHPPNHQPTQPPNHCDLQLANVDQMRDARQVARSILAKSVRAPLQLEDAINALIDVSGGLFVYLARVSDRLPPNITSLDTINALPTGLDALYLRFLRDERAALAASIAPALHVLVAAREPPNVADLCWMLGGASAADVESLLASLESLSWYQRQIVGDKTCVVPTHKSVTDFLCDKGRSRENYVNLAEAHACLAAACVTQLASMAGCVPPEDIAQTYAARYAVEHAKHAGSRNLVEPLESALGAVTVALGRMHLVTASATRCGATQVHVHQKHLNLIFCLTYHSALPSPPQSKMLIVRVPAIMLRHGHGLSYLFSE